MNHLVPQCTATTQINGRGVLTYFDPKTQSLQWYSDHSPVCPDFQHGWVCNNSQCTPEAHACALCGSPQHYGQICLEGSVDLALDIDRTLQLLPRPPPNHTVPAGNTTAQDPRSPMNRPASSHQHQHPHHHLRQHPHPHQHQHHGTLAPTPIEMPLGRDPAQQHPPRSSAAPSLVPDGAAIQNPPVGGYMYYMPDWHANTDVPDIYDSRPIWPAMGVAIPRPPSLS